MAVKRIDVRCVEIEDRPGSLQKLLSQAASANVDLAGFVAFSSGGGVGRLCLSAKEPGTLAACLESAGIEATEAVGFVIGGEDKVGAAAAGLKGLADAGISGVAGAAIACEGQYCMLIVVSAEDGAAAERALGA